MLITSTRSADAEIADEASLAVDGLDVGRRRVGRHDVRRSARPAVPSDRAANAVERDVVGRATVLPVPHRADRVLELAPQDETGAVPWSKKRGPVRGCDSTAAPSLHGSRLTRRGRLVVTVLWLVLVAFAVSPLLTGGGGVEAGVETVPVRVEAGDTLWQLVQRADSGTDPRQVIETVIEINGLRDGGDIRPGDVVQIPVSGY